MPQGLVPWGISALPSRYQIERDVMPSQVVVIGSKVGLHARPATLLIKACAAAGVPVTIGRVGETAVNAASMLSVLALGAKCGESVEITVGDGPDSTRVLNELVEIVQTDHDA